MARKLKDCAIFADFDFYAIARVNFLCICLIRWIKLLGFLNAFLCDLQTKLFRPSDNGLRSLYSSLKQR